MSPPLTDTKQLKKLRDLRRKYRRVNGHGPLRTQLTGFLSVIAFSFTALATASPLTTSTDSKPNFWTSVSILLQFGIDIALGVGTVFFLIATVASYKAVHDLSDLSPDVASYLLKDDETAYDYYYVMPHKADVDRAETIYREAGRLVPWGIGAVLFAVLAIGLHRHLVVGLAVALALVIALRTDKAYLRSVRKDVVEPVGKALRDKWRR
jgi:hypothetical protein